MNRLVGLLAQLSNPPDVSDILVVRSKREGQSLRRQRQVRLNEFQIQELVQHYIGGASLRDLERQFGIHRDTAARHLENNQIDRRSTKPKLSPSQVQSAIDRTEGGESLRSIAISLGVGLTTLRNAVGR